MMILDTLRLCVLGTLLGGLAAPASARAGGPATTVDAEAAPAARPQSADASRSRRVELPFPLDYRSPESAPDGPALRPDTTPHPFRESQLKRASFGSPPNLGRRLSPRPDFS